MLRSKYSIDNDIGKGYTYLIKSNHLGVIYLIMVSN
jgi:hypothetical protein